MSRIDVTVKAAQALGVLDKVKQALRPTGALGEGLDNAMRRGHLYALTTTPIDTSSWMGSHDTERQGLTGRIFVNPGARNSRTGVPVIRYAAIWEARGGRYAVYMHTVNNVGEQMIGDIRRAVERGVQDAQ